MKILFRLAKKEDVEEILAVYAPYILHTPITFEYTVPTLQEFSRRIEGISCDYPYFVCEMEGEIIGYAYASAYHERAAYQWDADLSIYLKQNITGKGIGRLMLDTLIALLKLQNIRNVYSCITHPNIPSEHLHETMGFRKCATFHHSGFKHGKWYDTLWYEKQIASTTGEQPEAFLPFHRVEQEAVRQILEEATLKANLI